MDAQFQLGFLIVIREYNSTFIVQYAVWFVVSIMYELTAVYLELIFLFVKCMSDFCLPTCRIFLFIFLVNSLG